MVSISYDQTKKRQTLLQTLGPLKTLSIPPYSVKMSYRLVG